jgi:hypothetical protein
LFKLTKVLETISARFAAKDRDGSSTTNSVTSPCRGKTETSMQYEILGLLATAEGPDLVDPAVLMLID